MSEANANQTEEERQAAAVAATDAHRAKFAANADKGTPAPEGAVAPVVHEKPEHVPEKFFNKETGEVNYEAWNTAHSALESKFHEGSEKPAEGESKETPAGDKPAPDGESPEVKKALETPAATSAAESYAQNGELSAADYTALEAEGYTRDMVDAYVAGKEAQASVITDAAFEPAGGEEKYGEMIAWAKDNLDATSKKAFNTQVSSGDPDVIRNAVTTLAAEYGKEATVEGERTGGATPSTNSSNFASRKEMSDAINKKGEDGRRLYDVDPAYRMEVTRKIGASRKAGTINF